MFCAMWSVYGRWVLLGCSDDVNVLVMLAMEICHKLLVWSLYPWRTVYPLYSIWTLVWSKIMSQSHHTICKLLSSNCGCVVLCNWCVVLAECQKGLTLAFLLCTWFVHWGLLASWATVVYLHVWLVHGY